jgi:hypothetical protein
MLPTPRVARNARKFAPYDAVRKRDSVEFLDRHRTPFFTAILCPG